MLRGEDTNTFNLAKQRKIKEALALLMDVDASQVSIQSIENATATAIASAQWPRRSASGDTVGSSSSFPASKGSSSNANDDDAATVRQVRRLMLQAAADAGRGKKQYKPVLKGDLALPGGPSWSALRRHIVAAGRSIVTLARLTVWSINKLAKHSKYDALLLLPLTFCCLQEFCDVGTLDSVVSGWEGEDETDVRMLERLLLLLDGDPGLALDPLPAGLGLERPLAEQLTALWEEPWARFRQAWSDGGGDLEQTFRAAAAEWRATGASATTPYAVRPRSDRSELVDDWIAEQPEGGSYAALMAQKELGSYFHPEPFCRAARKAEGAEREIRLPGHGLLEAVAALREGPAEAVLLHGCHWGRAELARRRARSGSIGFAQLLEGLDPGPDATAPTPLLRAVGQRYRAALIDEFQDTDPVQWRILRLAFPGDAHLLVMVGDPKQAIYRFRGGDLDTYRLARRSAARVLALQENRRSSAALIGSLNGLMAPAGLPRSGLPVPAVLGHEGAGIVEAVGAGVTHLQPGDRDAIVHVQPARSERHEIGVVFTLTHRSGRPGGKPRP